MPGEAQTGDQRVADAPARWSPRRCRLFLLIAFGVLLAAYGALHAEAKVLVSMAPATCPAGSPTVIQGGPGQGSKSDVAAVVTGWHAYTQAQRATASDDEVAAARPPVAATAEPEGTCRSVLARPTPADRLGTRSGLSVARAWLLTDALGFTPGYVAVLLGMVWWVRGIPSPEAELSTRKRSAQAHPEVPLLERLWRLANGTRKRTASARPRFPLLGKLWLLVNNKHLLTVLIVAGGVADWLENWTLWRGLRSWWRHLDGHGNLDGDVPKVGWIHLFSYAKLVFLLLPLLVALPFAIRQLVRGISAFVVAFPRLWAQAFVVAAFVLTLVGPLDQGQDALRRLSGRQWFGTLALLGVFTTAVGLSAAQVLKPIRPPNDDPFFNGLDDGDARRGDKLVSDSVLIVAGAFLIKFGGGHFRGLRVLGGMIAVIGLVAAFLDLWKVIPGSADVRDEQRVTDSRQRRRAYAERVGPALAAIAVTAFGYGTVVATAGDFVFAARGTGGVLLGRFIVGLAVTIASGPYALLLRKAVPKIDEERTRVVLVTAFLAPVIASALLLSPGIALRFAPEIGTYGLVCLFLTGFTLVGTVSVRVSRRLALGGKHTEPGASSADVVSEHEDRGGGGTRAISRRRAFVARIALPSSLRLFRVRAVPVLGLLVVWGLLATRLDLDGYHSIRQQPADRRTTAPNATEVAEQWRNRQGTAPGPALVVASAGGGIRAAFWTAAVMDCIIERDPSGNDPCGADAASDVSAKRRQALLVLSGASGGSVGLAEYVAAVGDGWGNSASGPAQHWYRDALGKDFLAPTVAGWLFSDTIALFMRPSTGVDRAALLERAWERAWPNKQLSQPFFAVQDDGKQPLLVMNGYDPTNGCKIVTSALITESGSVSDCTTASASAAGDLFATTDFATLCPASDIRFATAALNSARFPLVSPGGVVATCPDTGKLEVVDGGYLENSGAGSAVDAWHALSGQLQQPGKPATKGLFLQIDNGYRSPGSTATVARPAGVLTPVAGERNLANGVETAARQRAVAEFSADANCYFHVYTYAHPGSTAPLGWVLSSDSRSELEEQLKLNSATINHLRAALDGGACS